MKKFISALVLFVVVTMTTVFAAGCNYQVIDTNYRYDYAYVKIGEEWKNIEIKSWHDYDGEQLQLILPDGTVMLVSSYYCILYKGNLPE